uniref:Uncharacterized protein n=1 Tax=Stegastes partitus TaxID=144197 RepID=A0A3B5A3E8_9TELE
LYFNRVVYWETLILLGNPATALKPAVFVHYRQGCCSVNILTGELRPEECILVIKMGKKRRREI